MRARARSQGGARSVRAAAACSREGACPSARRLSTGGSRSTRVRERAAVRRESVCRVGQSLPACRHMEGHCVPRKPRHPSVDGKRNEPFLVRLALFASSQDASCP